MASLEVVVVSGPSAGSVIPLDGRSVTIGRSSQNTIHLRDDKVSSNHARLDVTPGGVILTDLGSKNGTFVGGEAVVGSRLIHPGTEVLFGSSVLELRYAHSVAAATPGSDVKLRSDQSSLRVAPPPKQAGRRAAAIPTSQVVGGPRAAASSASAQNPLASRIRASVTGERAAAPAPPPPRPAEPISQQIRKQGGDGIRDLVLQPAMHPGQRNLSKAQRNLAVLAEVGEMISSERDVERFLNRLMDLIFDVLPADRGCLILLEEGDRPVPRISRTSARAQNEEIVVSRTILSRVLAGASVLTADAGADARLSNGASIIAHNIRSVMCVPIRGRRKSVGAIYVDTLLTVGVFGKDDLEMLATVGVLAGTALENIQLFQENVQHERMAAIGKVVAGLGHDIRNMLTALRGGMYLLDESMKESPDDQMKSAWRIVQHGHESIANLVQDMVSYSKPRDPEWRLGDLNDVAQNAAAFAEQRASEKGAQLTMQLDPTIQHFWFDGAAIERCVLNLLTNAVDAVPDSVGVVSLQTRVDDERGLAIVTVQDNGEGIPPENRDKIFDLLFSTKGSRGTGFGLAITRKLVQEHNGRIWFNSDLGKGSTFHIELPLRTQRPAAVLV
ncbi:MAG: Adaptive-response sensory-kinase SasA [Planctomycetes bacterium]|nr:Adaptive-response sensory-kinase SasA [Planctomycetota bacterium]